MIEFSLSMKSGTGGYEDYDNCDLILKSVMLTETLPRTGETIQCKVKDSYRTFLIQEIRHIFNDNKCDRTVLYCVPIDGKPII